MIGSMTAGRPAIVTAAVIAVALSFPAASGAVNDGYRGETEAGGLVAVRVDYDHKGSPTKVHSLRWANVPAACAGYAPTATSGDVKLSMKVDDRGAFKGSDKLDIGDAKVTIAGRFKHDPAKASGTFQVKGSVPGCANADTGKLSWEMARK